MPAHHPTLGAKLRYWRDHRGLTLRELHELSGVAWNTICAYELGKINASFQQVQKLAKALGISPDTLWDLSPPPETAPPESHPTD